jgi:hypothetical protein
MDERKGVDFDICFGYLSCLGLMVAIMAVFGFLSNASVNPRKTPAPQRQAITTVAPTTTNTPTITSTPTTTSTTSPFITPHWMRTKKPFSTPKPIIRPTLKPTKVPAQVVPDRSNCSPSYPTVCIPPPPPDLNCEDIPYRRFKVLQPDPHNFDGDFDGIGCEWD